MAEFRSTRSLEIKLNSEQSRSNGAARLPLALHLIIIFLFAPEAMSFVVFDLRLTVIRLLFLLLVPTLLFRLGSKIETTQYRFVPSDLFVPLAGIWMFVGVSNTSNFGSAMAHSGPIALEFCIGYMVTRLMLRERGQALLFAGLLCVAIAIVAVLGFLDPLLGHYVIKDWASELTGYVKGPQRMDYRMGLLRAAGPVEHSILYGFACAVGMLLAISVRIPARILVILTCGLGVFFSFSSAPIMCVIFGGSFLAYDRILAGVRGRWLVLIGLTGILAVLFFSAANAPMSFIFRHLILDPMSGYERQLQWNIAGGWLLQTSPWFGLGYPEIVYPIPKGDDLTSIDSLWLGLGIAFGIPASVLVGLSIVSACLLPSAGRDVYLTAMESRLATTLSIVLIVTVFLGFTVTLWGTAWVLCGLLTGARAHLGELGTLRSKKLD